MSEKKTVTLIYENVYCHDVILPEKYINFIEKIKTLYNINNKSFGTSNICIRYQKKMKDKRILNVIVESDIYQNLKSDVRKGNVKEIFINDIKYMNKEEKLPEDYEDKIGFVVFHEIYKTRNKIIDNILQYTKKSELINKNNDKLNKKVRNVKCTQCGVPKEGYLYRSISEPQKYFCNKCAYSIYKLPLLKIP